MKVMIEVPDGTTAFALVGVYKDGDEQRLGAILMHIEDCEIIEEDDMK